jgi:preprotein translocase subunit YajC
MSFFIPEAMAAEPAGAAAAYQPFIMLALFAAIFYFLIWRPQSKRTKEHKALMEGLSKGDEVITSGGIAGKIMKVSDTFIVLEVAEGTSLNCSKAAVANVLPKGTLRAI